MEQCHAMQLSICGPTWTRFEPHAFGAKHTLQDGGLACVRRAQAAQLTQQVQRHSLHNHVVQVNVRVFLVIF